MRAEIIGLAVGEKRGESKKAVSEAEFKAGFGIVGDTIKLGPSVTLKVVQIGKILGPDHTFNFQGQVPLADHGIFTSVESGGKVRVGDSVEVITNY